MYFFFFYFLHQTETTKFILQFFAHVGKSATHLEEKVLRAEQKTQITLFFYLIVYFFYFFFFFLLILRIYSHFGSVWKFAYHLER